MNILFVEDMPQDYEIAVRMLRKEGMEFDSIRVDTREGFLDALGSFNPEIIVSDYSMPQFDGMSALLIAREQDPLLPFVVLTGSMNEDTAVSCMKAGASDYVIKEHMARLPFAVREALERGEMLRRAREQEVLLRQSEERYRTLFQGSSAVMLILDPETCSILDANEAAVRFYGWTREQLAGRPLVDINPLDGEVIRERVRRALNREQGRFEGVHRKADGSMVEVEAHAGPVVIGSKICVLSIIHDISERMAAERDRDLFSARLEQYLARSPTITFSLVFKDGGSTIDWISKNVSTVLGYEPEEAISPDWWFQNVHPQDRSRALQGPIEASKSGASSQEYRFLRKDKSAVWLLEELRSMRSEEGRLGMVGTLTDISDRKKAEEEIRLKSAALESAENAVCITDRSSVIEWVNGAFERLYGYSRDESVGRTLEELVRSGIHDGEFYESLWQTVSSGQVWHGEIWNRRKNGEAFREEVTITPIKDQDGRITHFISVKSDITERYKSRELLEASLREKETLLREIHHRVKNNLQVVSSLLSLSADSDSSPVFRAGLESVMRRINAIALVHEQFYSSGDVARIEFSSYLRDIVDYLRSFNLGDSRVPTILFEVEEVYLSLEDSIPAGIVVSEFVSNALRHGCGSMVSDACVTVRLARNEGGEIVIEVKDNGQGFPTGMDTSKPETLGMKLVDILASQLRGAVRYEITGGVTATLRFIRAEDPG